VERRTVAVATAVALLWVALSGARVYPHSLSYFNELAGGPVGGPRYLLDANVDWGQDLWYLKRWYDDHPDARPFHVACYGFVSPAQVGIAAPPPPVWPPEEDGVSRGRLGGKPAGPVPGWHAVSVNLLCDPKGRYGYGRYGYLLTHFRPVAMVGYSIYIYHITPAEADAVRARLGLPPLKR
jgi:hypothetical protein